MQESSFLGCEDYVVVLSGPKRKKKMIQQKQSTSASNRKREQGFTLLEVIVSLGIIATATIGLNMIASRYSDETKVAIAASQVRTFGEAAKAYIKDNYASVQAVATPTTPAMVDVPTLVASGHLTTGTLPANAYGQSLCALVLEPTANRLQALVVAEGGSTIDDLTLGSLVAIVGGSGGGVYSSDDTVIRGAVGGWSIPTATFDNLVNNVSQRCDGTAGNVRVAIGTPGMALWFENGDTSSGFLARDAVPGRPELNEMNTPLIMNSVQTLNAACTRIGAIGRNSTGAVLSCNGGVWKTQGSSFWEDPVADFASLPACTASINGQTRIALTPSVGSGARVYTCQGLSWQALAVDNAGNLTVPQRITGGGSETSYGALTVLGEKNGYSGLNFKTAAGANAGTVMMNPNYSGFYNSTDNAWRFYADNAGNTVQSGRTNNAGTTSASSSDWGMRLYDGASGANVAAQSAVGSAYVNDIYVRSAGKWASQLGSASIVNTSGDTGTMCALNTMCRWIVGSGQCMFMETGRSPIAGYQNIYYWGGYYMIIDPWGVGNVPCTAGVLWTGPGWIAAW